MKLLFIILWFSTLIKIDCQDLYWSKTKDWRLYDSRGISGFDFPVEKTNKLGNIQLEMGIIKQFVSNVTEISPDSTPIWMGKYVATYETEQGNKRLVFISTYGGFFYDPQSTKYFQLPRERRKEWLDFFATTEATLQKRDEN